jgi:hypothetical protein
MSPFKSEPIFWGIDISWDPLPPPEIIKELSGNYRKMPPKILPVVKRGNVMLDSIDVFRSSRQNGHCGLYGPLRGLPCLHMHGCITAIVAANWPLTWQLMELCIRSPGHWSPVHCEGIIYGSMTEEYPTAVYRKRGTKYKNRDRGWLAVLTFVPGIQVLQSDLTK